MSYKNKNNLNLVTNNFFLELVFSSLVLAESFPLQPYEMYSNRGSWLKTLFYRLEVLKEALVTGQSVITLASLKFWLNVKNAVQIVHVFISFGFLFARMFLRTFPMGYFICFSPTLLFLMIRPLSWMTTAICFQFQTWIESILHKKWPSKFLFKCAKLRDAVVIFSAGCALVSLAGSHTPPQFNKWRGY